MRVAVEYIFRPRVQMANFHAKFGEHPNSVERTVASAGGILESSKKCYGDCDTGS